MGVKSWLEEWTPFAAMVMVECLDVGLSTLSKAAMTKGMSHFVFVVYSNALATLIFLPLFIFQRKKTPPVSFSLLCKFFLLGLAGISILQNCVFAGISYSSPTLGSAMSNLAPAFTFVLAVFFRMEKLDLGNLKGQIKIMGTLVSISGALIITIYKGPAILIPPFQSIQNTSPPSNSSYSSMILRATTSNWIIGGLLLTIASLSFSIWNIAQAAILKEYPSKMTILFFYYFFGSIQCALLTFIVEGDLSVWALRPDIELISVLYSGVCGSVLVFSILTWCINKKGPVFAVMFKPLGIAIAAFMSTIFLGDTLYAGSVIGSFPIVIGFYGVIWAQSEERKDENHGIVDGLQSSSPQTPLLDQPM